MPADPSSPPQELRRAAEAALQSGQPGEAAQLAESVLSHLPDDIRCRLIAAQAHHQQGQHKAAFKHLREGIKLDPTNVDLLLPMAALLDERGQAEPAVRHYRQALTQRPDDPAVRNAYGELLMRPDTGVFDSAKARRQFDHVIAAQPDYAPAMINLGVLEHRDGRYREALDLLQRAADLLAQSPTEHAIALRNAADVLRDLGRLDDALATYEHALNLDPENPQAQLNRAMTLLLAGRFADGFDAYEARWSQPRVRPPSHPAPAWSGAPVDGGSLAVIGEQGLGDQIMFASCLPELDAFADSVSVQVEPRLVSLFARSFSDCDIRPIGTADANADAAAHCPMGSLPRFLRRSRDDFPDHAGYLTPDRARVQIIAQQLSALGPGRRIGFSWRSASPAGGARRSADLAEDWRPVLTAPGCVFVALQYGEITADIADAPAPIHVLADLDPSEDIDGLAAAIGALDLVITTANVTAHLAGALGKPVWVLVPDQPSWRWLASGDSCPWYPSLRLFRQHKPGDWTAPMAALRSALDQWIASHG